MKRLAHLRGVVIGLALLAALMAPDRGAAQTATLPSMKALSADLVSPASAQAFYGASTTHTSSFAGIEGFEGQPPEIVETARALKNNPDLIFEFVRNQIRVEYAFGLRKGPVAALIDKSGTPFDQNVLFVNLVRQAGLPARYQIGPVTMTGTDFANWTGVSDLQAACRLLSSGGVPAAFNGASSSPADCSLSGAFTSVTFLHIWSQVQIGGVWYAYDPSFKPLSNLPGRDLVAASGLVAGQAASLAASTIDTGTQASGVYIHNASQTDLEGYLGARGAQLLNDLKANTPDQDTATVVGLRKIVPAYAPPGGWRNTTPPGYTVGASIQIAGDIPDQYRSTLDVQLSARLDGVNSTVLFDKLLYADDIGARRIVIASSFLQFVNPATGTSFPQSYLLNVDGVAVASFTCTASLPTPTYPCPLGQGGNITLAVTHPYAAAGGTYGDQTMSRDITTLAAPVAIVAGWGWVSPELLAKWSGEVAQDTPMPTRGSPPIPCGSGEFCWERYPQSSENFTKSRIAAAWLSQFSRMLDIQAQLGAATADHQHSVGIVDWRAKFSVYHFPAPPDPTSKTYYGIADQFAEINLDTAVSITSRANDQARTDAIFRSVALSGATIEGAVLEEMENLPDAASTASRLAWSNTPDDEDPCSGGRNPRRFFDFTNTNAANRSSIFLYEGSTSGCGAAPTIVGASPTDWENAAENAVAAYMAAGFRVSGSAETYLGPGARFGAPIFSGAIMVGANFSNQRGAALIATRQDANGRTTEVAHVLAGLNGLTKGGGGKQPERFTEYDPQKAADILKDRFVDRSVALGVDLKTGTAGYTTPTLLSVGGDQAPYGFTYVRTYKNAFSGCTIYGPCTGAPQGGWTHNWDIRFSNSGSGMEALGQTSPFAASGSLVAFLAMQDIFLSSGRSELEKDFYAAMTADWWRRQMVANVATVSQGFSGKQYVRLVDNSWLPPIGSPGVLTQSGARSKIRDRCITQDYYSTSRRWDFAGVTFSLRNAGGDVMSFSPWSYNYDVDNQCAITYGYQPTSWAFPQGPSLSFTYDYVLGVTAVTSSLGRTLTLGNDALGAPQASSAGLSVHVVSGGVQDATGATYKFDIGQSLLRTATQRPIPYGQLLHVYEPVNANAPALEYVYDGRGLVRQASDATTLQWQNRAAYFWFIAEGARGERDDPAGGTYTVYYDTDGDAVRHIDELGREITSTYDGRHRVKTRTYPETDQDQFSYDAADNVVGLTKVAKTGSGLANITLSASYETSWNKLSWVRDAFGRQTDFSYYGSGAGASMLQQVQRPAVGGVRPVYTFQYNANGLLTQAVDPTGVTTTYGYDGLGNRTSMTAGAAAVGANPALNLTTTYAPDAVGNVVTETSPRSFATTRQYDNLRRTTYEYRRNGGATAVPLAVTHWIYDPNGRKIEEDRAATIDGSGNVTSWQTWIIAYTPTGQVAQVQDPAGQSTRTIYDPLDRPWRAFDAQGRVTQTNYDLAGQKIAEIRALGTPAQQTWATYAYTPNGQQDWVQDAAGAKTDYTYDGFDRLSQTTYPNPTTGAPNSADYEALTYDVQNNVRTRRMRGGATLTMTYDPLDRLSTKAVPAWSAGAARTATYGYDLAGRQTSVSEASQSLGWTFDAAGRQITETIDGPLWVGGSKTVYTAYNLDSVRNRLTWPDGWYVAYGYDGMDRMVSATVNGVTQIAGFTPNPLSQVTAETRQSGTVSRIYNLKGDPTNVTHTWTSTSLTFGYGYDRSRKLVSKTVNLPGYALAGPATGATAYTPDRLNRYTAVAGGAYGYDGNQNLASGGGSTFAYDAENRLLSATTALGSGAYTYDPIGRRIGKGINGAAATLVLSAGDTEIAAYSYTGTMSRRWVPGPETDRLIAQYDVASGAPSFYRQDRQGSTVAMTDATGALTEGPYTYDAYGAPNVTTGTPFRYTGRRYDPETGLYYYRARFYSAPLGRFLQTDPVGYDAGDLNLYAYVGNDPTNMSDPSGMIVPVIIGAAEACAATPCGVAVAAGTAAVGVAATKAWVDSGAPQAIERWLSGIVHNESQAPPLPTGPVGTPPHTQGKGGQTQSGPLHPDYGGTGDAEQDFGHLTGGTGKPNESGGRKPGTQVGANGIQIRPGKEGQGPRIDIPANGSNPGQTLHYPPPKRLDDNR